VAELLGQHRYQLDDKGRIAMPTKFRGALKDGVVLTLGQGNCLWVFPAADFASRAAEFRGRPLDDPDTQHYLRFFFGSAETGRLDNQSRLTIPQKLRAQVGIDREAVVMGLFDRLEIWSARAWDSYEQEHVGEYRAGAMGPGRR
jgi:MraZ protein